jgi:hypothetical protein
VAKSGEKTGKEKEKERRRTRQGQQPGEMVWKVDARLVGGALLLAYVLVSIALLTPLSHKYYLNIMGTFRTLLLVSVGLIAGTVFGTALFYFQKGTLNVVSLRVMLAAVIVTPLGYGAFNLAQHLYGYDVPPGSATADLLSDEYLTEWKNFDMKKALPMMERYVPGDAPEGVTAFYQRKVKLEFFEGGPNRFWLQVETGNTFRHYGPFKGNPADVLPPPAEAEPDQE